MNFLPPAKLDFIESWSILGSPKFLIILFNFYFFAVKLGKHLMRNRAPFELTFIIRAYNIFQVFTCIAFAFYLNFRVGYETFSSTWKCRSFEEENFDREFLIEIFSVQWFFMAFRSIELIETLFFVMRKKEKQISFLHIYHHVSTLVLLYIMNRYSASMMDLYVGSLNNYVHILMYLYYFFSSFRSIRRSVRRVKPIMTTIQMIQLTLLLGHSVTAKVCGESVLFYLLTVNFAILMILFGHFYYETYLKARLRKIL